MGDSPASTRTKDDEAVVMEEEESIAGVEADEERDGKATDGDNVDNVRAAVVPSLTPLPPPSIASPPPLDDENEDESAEDDVVGDKVDSKSSLACFAEDDPLRLLRLPPTPAVEAFEAAK